MTRFTGISRILINSLFVLMILPCAAQEAAFGFEPIDEKLIVESKWRYTYTLHVESNTVIHKAGDLYKFFLYFKYNYQYEEILNEQFNQGKWNLDERRLNYQFKHIENFEIKQLTKKILILEFTQPNSKGFYQYHFVRVSGKDSPFIKPPNELPDVIVEVLDPNEKEKKRNWFPFRRNKKKRKKSKYVPQEKEVYINIELAGGGFYGGMDPVLKDFIHIKSSGRLIKEFHSVYNGLIVTKKDIPRQELEAFVEYIEAQNFFEMERLYDCDSPACEKRKGMKPKPMPLRLSVAYGNKKKVITIPIWGKDDYNIQYIDYPVALDNIIDAIQRMANRLEISVARK